MQYGERYVDRRVYFLLEVNEFRRAVAESSTSVLIDFEYDCKEVVKSELRLARPHELVELRLLDKLPKL